eukprot:c10844_g1_i2.p1 GENE.c10844_g1_i2~~c10844_g1_i2.p1  ORF type:complete len:298 (-),score=67.02 c10844_g1_i2:622-1440(-)
MAESPDIATCSEMNDVWINEIGPKLEAQHIVALSLVNKWGHRTAHAITSHTGKYPTCTQIDLCLQARKTWPHLKFQLSLSRWKQSPTTTPTPAPAPMAMTAHEEQSNHEKRGHTQKTLCQAVFLLLLHCRVFDFGFVETSHLQAVVIKGPTPTLNDIASRSLEKMLLSCESLTSLELSYCVDEFVDITWLVNALKHLRLLTNLNLHGVCLIAFTCSLCSTHVLSFPCRCLFENNVSCVVALHVCECVLRGIFGVFRVVECVHVCACANTIAG